MSAPSTSTFAFVTAFVALLAVSPVSAQGLPDWAEPSEPRESQVQDREIQRERPQKKFSRSRREPLGPGYRTGSLGPQRQGFWDIVGCLFGSEQSCAVACEEDAQPGTEAYDWCQQNGYLPADKVPVDDYLPLPALAGLACGVIRLRS